MPAQPARTPARMIAPAALAAVVVALVLIVVSSTAGGGDESPGGASTAGEPPATTAPARRGKSAARSTYVVKRNDTLGAIAQKTGVEVERLQELNPQLDPQALIAGQKIKLRE